MVFTPDGKKLLSASADKTVQILDIESQLTIATFSEHTNGVTRIAVTKDGKHAVSSSLDGTARIWKLPGALPPATAVAKTGPQTQPRNSGAT